MQLFITGPAFGLPSIDAECNAAVALLQSQRPHGYQLIPTHDQSRRLPDLIDGQTQASGFTNIARHLALRRESAQGSQTGITQESDSIAISSFVESNAPTLLDISLYVGFENYRLATRPAFTKILPWHTNYLIPPNRRAAARLRTEHLGISTIDVDNVHEDMSNRPPGMEAVGKEPAFEAETQKRASLLLPRKDTLRSLLQRPEHAAVFKLHALADNFFQPLQDMLGERTYALGGDDITAIDCLLYGYLSLMLYPKLPQDWLASTLRSKYPRLAAYVERIHQKLKLSTSTADVVGLLKRGAAGESLEKRQGGESSLPWRAPAPLPMIDTAKNIMSGAWEQLPMIGDPCRLWLSDPTPVQTIGGKLKPILFTSAVSFAMAGYLSVRWGWLTWPRGEEVQIFGRKRLSDYGHLGAALAGIGTLGPQIARGG